MKCRDRLLIYWNIQCEMLIDFLNNFHYVRHQLIYFQAGANKFDIGYKVNFFFQLLEQFRKVEEKKNLN